MTPAEKKAFAERMAAARAGKGKAAGAKAPAAAKPDRRLVAAEKALGAAQKALASLRGEAARPKPKAKPK